MNAGAFVRSNWKFIAIVTVVLSIIALVLLSFLPQQYSRQFTLDVVSVPTGLFEELDQNIVDPTQAANLAVSYLQDASFEEVSVIPSYNVRTRQVDVTLQSESREALEGAGDQLADTIEERFQGSYEESLGAALTARLENLDTDLRAEREALELLETRMDQASSGSASSSDPQTMARLQGLETEHAYSVAEIARLQSERRELEQAQGNLSGLAAEPIAANIVSSSDISQSRSFAPMAVLAVMLSFIAAVTVAIIRTTLRHAK